MNCVFICFSRVFIGSVMEDENKKKKRNKKKKNKQNKTAEEVADGDQSHVSNGQNDESQSQVSEAAANVGTDEQDPDVYPTRNGSNGGDSVSN